MSKLRLLELFSGVGTFSMAFRNLKIPYEIVDSVEIDPYPVKAFNAIHDSSFSPQDISNWDKDIDADIITHGSPCTNFSIAGQQAGGDKGSNTASSLMWETVRIVKKLRPRYVIWENVKNILSAKHRHNFDAYQKTLEALGYQSYYQVLNAKDYGVPQNRERVFTVSILGNTEFKFPNPILLTKKLKDVLEKEVEGKYYLPEEKTRNLRLKESKTTNVEAMLNIKGQENIRRVYSKDGVCPTLSTMQGGLRQPKIIDDTYGYETCFREYKDISPTLRSGRQGLKVMSGYRVRKLTPRECWRLMGYSDTDFDKAKATKLSDSRLYKMAGNGIALPVVEAIFRELFNV